MTTYQSKKINYLKFWKEKKNSSIINRHNRECLAIKSNNERKKNNLNQPTTISQFPPVIFFSSTEIFREIQIFGLSYERLSDPQKKRNTFFPFDYFPPSIYPNIAETVFFHLPEWFSARSHTFLLSGRYAQWSCSIPLGGSNIHSLSIDWTKSIFSKIMSSSQMSYSGVPLPCAD